MTALEATAPVVDSFATLRVVVARGLSSTATFAVLPYLALVILDNHLGSASAAATMVGVYVLCLRAGGVISAPVVRLLSRSQPLPVLYFAATVFLIASVVAIKLEYQLVLAAAALMANALSVAVANVLTKATIAAEPDDCQRVFGFGMLSRAINGGAAVGGLAGSFAVHYGPFSVLVPAAALVAMASAFCVGLPRVSNNSVGVHVKVDGGDWPRRIGFVVSTAMVWLAYVQFFAVLPIYARGSSASEWIGAVFAINAIMIVALQKFVLKRTANLFATLSSQWRVYLAACGCMATSLILLCAVRTHAWPVLFMAIILLTLSELFWSPLLDAWTALVFGQRNLLAAYTITGLAWGGAEAAASSLSIPIAAGAISSVPWYSALGASGLILMIAAVCVKSTLIGDQATAARVSNA